MLAALAERARGKGWCTERRGGNHGGYGNDRTGHGSVDGVGMACGRVGGAPGSASDCARREVCGDRGVRRLGGAAIGGCGLHHPIGGELVGLKEASGEAVSPGWQEAAKRAGGL